ncbi:MAG: calcium/sodium antiporter [Chloroflexota bacterium]|nr:calcium/sodium antiporter [Chloroflexota bacterium]
MLNYFILIALGLVGLFFGGNWLVKGAARFATALGVSPLVIGLTIVAFGTSVPELLVSIDSALKGVSDIALGNVVGSNIANIGLILGVTAMIYPVAIEWSLLRREIPLMIVASFALMVMVFDGQISQFDGFILFAGFIGFNVYALVMARRDKRQIMQELAQYEKEEGITNGGGINKLYELLRLAAGIVLLIFGAQWTVEGAVGVAQVFGVSSFIIGVTVVAFGTSLPELTASVIGALRKENDIVMGNVIGSNVANILAILGITAMITPIGVAERIYQFDMVFMIGFALALMPFLLRNIMKRWMGALFFVVYCLFITLTVTTT